MWLAFLIFKSKLAFILDDTLRPRINFRIEL